ncbi:MAG: hypothetical protein ACKO9Q_04305, partial [Pirellula sp.]
VQDAALKESALKESALQESVHPEQAYWSARPLGQFLRQQEPSRRGLLSSLHGAWADDGCPVCQDAQGIAS